ncbi:HET-domain-containing protein, partial [Lophiostoma macrostomum CBS 122681]
MYLLSTHTLQLREFFGKAVPPYAILSHTWTDDELRFSDIHPSTSRAARSKSGYEKVFKACAFAKKEGFEHIWVDSCCIDKSSSAELTEAINSMYSYYRDASVCIIYLADVPGLAEPDMGADKAYWLYRFKSSRWFTRGWCLQELIAPKRRIWLARDWSYIDPAEFSDPNAKFLDTVASVTGISIEVLKDRTTMSHLCIAERMSWASARRTTRPEDAAYSLMGLFGINMAVLYGEGLENAFGRLQGEIMKTSFDQTIFAWRGPYNNSGLLAHSPADFARTPKLGLWGRAPLSPFSMTNVGLHIR